jgi:glycosyltransferase involved in cell wall biosynthesis
MTGLKILQVVPTLSPFFGGGVNVVRNISRELAKNNDVSVYTTTRYDHEKDVSLEEEMVDGYNINYFKRNLKTGFLDELNISFDMMRAVQENLSSFDVIHLHSYRQYEDYLILKYAPKKRVPYVMHAHGTLAISNKRAVKQFYEVFWGRKLVRNASRVLAISPTEVSQFAKLGVPEEKIDIVYNGLNLNAFSELPPSGIFRSRYGIDDCTRLILYLGRLDPTKGVDFLIGAFNYAVNTAGLTNVKLAVCGPDFGFLPKANVLVKQYGLSDKVLFTGMLSEEEKLQAYVDADIVAYPEVSNVWGLVPMEAAACGKPVIVSETNHIASVVKTGKFGFAVKYGNVPEFGKLLTDALKDTENLRHMGCVGKEFVQQNFSWEKSIPQLERIYSEVSV